MSVSVPAAPDADSLGAAPTGQRRTPWWKRLLGWLALTVLVWAVVIFVWQVNRTEPGAGDLLLWLVALPIGLIAAVHLLRAGLRRRSAPVAANASAATDAAVGAHPAAPQYALHLHAQAVYCRLGADAEAALAALPDAPRPGLHPTLRDCSGLPVFAAPVDDLDVDTTAMLLQEVAGNGAGDWDEEVMRALALLEPVADALLIADLEAQAPDEAAALPERDALPDYVFAHSRSVRATPQARRPVLGVHLLLPARWPSDARTAAAQWLRARVRAFGHRDDGVELDVLPLSHAPEVWSLIDRLGVDPHAWPGVDRHLVLAADCLVGANTLEELEQARRLFGAAHPEGRIPGEAAAGLLLGAGAAGDRPGPTALTLGRPVLEPACREGRSTRAAVRAAAAVCAQALTAGRQSAAAVRALVSDADQRPSRSVEAAATMVAQLPDLEPDVHGLHFGVACGDVGLAAPVVLLALAGAQAAQAQAPVLAMSLADDVCRVALTVAPFSTPTAAAMATAAAA